MTGEDFEAFITYMGWSEREVARVMQLSRNSVAKYKREGAKADIDFACAALAAGLPKWSEREK
ncbi:MAG: hypothetical protein OSA41_00740 [Erythrobacter sp.]|uniref:hypothetical protein n=1 Tax=Qipengyuania citrea TaxID=225971 RepID=UPI000BC5810C|nr:hypothetical protein [Qipengyuania citrea]MBL4719042.1 hypothetical protein [Erythrobacter sp.]MCP2016153.1 transposase [Qipengyuania citrea]MDE0900225.1 hypothetical protein [Erythrobacter sp.]PCH75808.1 MAG: hypothetical protein COC07_08605 [Erythrobacteraceae bacterium]